LSTLLGPVSLFLSHRSIPIFDSWTLIWWWGANIYKPYLPGLEGAKPGYNSAKSAEKLFRTVQTNLEGQRHEQDEQAGEEDEGEDFGHFFKHEEIDFWPRQVRFGSGPTAKKWSTSQVKEVNDGFTQLNTNRKEINNLFGLIMPNKTPKPQNPKTPKIHEGPRIRRRHFGKLKISTKYNFDLSTHLDPMLTLGPCWITLG
jgi:hypothetical protein